MLKKACAVSLKKLSMALLKKSSMVSVKKTFAALLILLLLSLPSLGFQEGVAWPTFDSPEGRFSVIMPTKPTVETKDVDSAVGKLTMYAYSSPSSVAYFMVSFGDYPKEPVDAAQQEAVLSGVQGGVLKGLEGELLSEAKIGLSGYPGREFKAKRTVEGSEVVFTWKIYLVGRRLYQVAAATTPADAQSPDVAKFFTSFQIKN